jgi:hypothetical protein
VYCECLCPARRWGAHRGLAVLLCRPICSRRGHLAHTRRRALGLLHRGVLKEGLCFLA